MTCASTHRTINTEIRSEQGALYTTGNSPVRLFRPEELSDEEEFILLVFL